jgi:hypothetical protein
MMYIYPHIYLSLRDEARGRMLIGLIWRRMYAYPGPSLYTDTMPCFRPAVRHQCGDARVADAAAQWTGVATSSLTIAVAGDFASIGLPNIVPFNLGLVYGAFNGGGYHVIYDPTRNHGVLAGPLSTSSPEWAVDTPDRVLAVLTARRGAGRLSGERGKSPTHEMPRSIGTACTAAHSSTTISGGRLRAVRWPADQPAETVSVHRHSE